MSPRRSELITRGSRGASTQQQPNCKLIPCVASTNGGYRWVLSVLLCVIVCVPSYLGTTRFFFANSSSASPAATKHKYASTTVQQQQQRCNTSCASRPPFVCVKLTGLLRYCLLCVCCAPQGCRSRDDNCSIVCGKIRQAKIVGPDVYELIDSNVCVTSFFLTCHAPRGFRSTTSRRGALYSPGMLPVYTTALRGFAWSSVPCRFALSTHSLSLAVGPFHEL